MTTSDRILPSTESADELSAVIRAEIQSSPDHRITFDRFMELALYHLELGYYRSAADRPTHSGDFLTAPETHPIFGWTLARRIERVWVELDRPADFHVIEYGAGSGTLALMLIEGLRRHGATGTASSATYSTGLTDSTALLDALRYTPIESNPHRRADLTRNFEEAGFARLLDLPAPTPSAGWTGDVEVVPVTGVLIANEFLDALPVHRVLFRDGKLHELFVAWRGEPGGEGVFREIVGEPSTPELAARLADDGVSLADGQVAEICLELEPWLEEASARLTRGFALILDYGFDAAELYGPRHLAGTLLGYRGHRVVENPFSEPGSVDLTAHVDFTAVSRLAGRHGFRTVSSTTQSEFLVAAGLEAEWETLRTAGDLDVAGYAAARSALVRLLDPRHLGGFRVLSLAI